MTSGSPDQTLKSCIRERACLLGALRGYLSSHQCTEVTTPVLRPFGVTDPFIASISAYNEQNRLGFLQTSPEYAMKRLLCLGSGDIWQLGPVFRSGETGQRHRSEFTMLEWYRCGWTLSQLMDEMIELTTVAATAMGPVADDALGQLTSSSSSSPTKRTYRSLFEDRFGINPHAIETARLASLCTKKLGSLGQHIDPSTARSEYHDALFSQLIEPTLESPTFVTEFPREQAALARVAERRGDTVALRFELYWRGVELANGYSELGDQAELNARFVANNATRKAMGLPEMPLDDEFLALIDVLPDCVGVALGVDRLHMVLTGRRSLAGTEPGK